MLLWALALSTWSLAVGVFSRKLPETFAARMIGVLGIISIGFQLFILLTSSPFERLVPAALDGRDLNPLLQDPALAIHPPMLYIATWASPWPLRLPSRACWKASSTRSGLAGCGRGPRCRGCSSRSASALGSWWAYYELGWAAGGSGIRSRTPRS